MLSTASFFSDGKWEIPKVLKETEYFIFNLNALANPQFGAAV